MDYKSVQRSGLSALFTLIGVKQDKKTTTTVSRLVMYLENL